GAAASLISGAVGGVCDLKNVPAVWTKTAMIAAGGLGGGVSSLIAGGDFVEGVCNGLICAGLNHALHYVVEGGGKPSYKQHKKINVPRQHGRMDCKYAIMEAIAKHFGETEMSQSDFKRIGNMLIKNNSNISMREMFQQMGFLVSSQGTDLGTMFTAMDQLDFPIAVEYKPDGNYGINHVGVMESLSKNSCGELVIRLSDPYFGDNHMINPYNDNNCYYQFYGYQSIPNMLNIPIKGLHYY
ncbi:MAG: hypothetical protein IKZ55_08275, partial [Bacteroidales bacterium]|nr:hypothetical protein [Bacteroidales bacterium]